MKLRKIFAAIAASAVIMGMSATCFAVADGEATYCFDTANKLTDWQTYGNAEETGFTISHDVRHSNNGEGCIVISEKNPSELSDGDGGAYIEASSVGLSTFSGCTISMSVLLCDGAEDYCENFAIYSDGIVWLQTPPENLNTSTWSEVSLALPDGADNTRVGFTIPTLAAYSGDIVYIDDFTVTNADGVVIKNVGDYQAKTLTSENTVSGGTNILLTILLVVLILAIVGGIGFIVSSAIKKFH
ncbi:MAG: hypothetical protein K2H23_00380 [Oscillospiraceae bacterium]|nr:hypothetical protein [Oscillospiraceae bacterium]